MQSVDFGVNFDISVGEDGFHLGNVSKDKAILFFTSMSHLASGVIVKSKCLKVPTCFILSPLQRMLHTGMSGCFKMTMHSVFFAFS